MKVDFLDTSGDDQVFHLKMCLIYNFCPTLSFPSCADSQSVLATPSCWCTPSPAPPPCRRCTTGWRRSSSKERISRLEEKNNLLLLLIVNAKDVPIVIAGNKVDLADEGREIFVEDVKDWVDQQYRQNR